MDKNDRKLMERYLGNIEKHSIGFPQIGRNVDLIRNLMKEETNKFSEKGFAAWKTRRTNTESL